MASEKAQFEYAWCLIRSKHEMDMKKGVSLLEGENWELVIKVNGHELRDSKSAIFILPSSLLMVNF